jgi:hypothetical protein
MLNTTSHNKVAYPDTILYSIVTPKKRIEIARSIFGSWKHRSRKELDKELKKIRAEWDRSLPDLR